MAWDGSLHAQYDAWQRHQAEATYVGPVEMPEDKKKGGGGTLLILVMAYFLFFEN